MLVLIGYDENNFITNDPGTRRGEKYKYPQERVVNAIHDWTGTKETIPPLDGGGWMGGGVNLIILEDFQQLEFVGQLIPVVEILRTAELRPRQVHAQRDVGGKHGRRVDGRHHVHRLR